MTTATAMRTVAMRRHPLSVATTTVGAVATPKRMLGGARSIWSVVRADLAGTGDARSMLRRRGWRSSFAFFDGDARSRSFATGTRGGAGVDVDGDRIIGAAVLRPFAGTNATAATDRGGIGRVRRRSAGVANDGTIADGTIAEGTIASGTIASADAAYAAHASSEVDVDVDVDFDVPSYAFGSDPAQLVVSILGPPNAGKSTLFNRLLCKEANRAYRLGSENKRPGRSQARVGYAARSKHGKKPRAATGGAIVTPVAGTTRDRRECVGRIGAATFRLVDTAGVDGEKIDAAFGKQRGSMEGSMIRQTMEAARKSDLILLLFDARVGVTSDLSETIRWLRKIDRGDEKTESGVHSNNNDDDAPTERPGRRRREILILANKLEGDRWTLQDVEENTGDGGGGARNRVLDALAEVGRAGFGEAIPISAEHGEGLADVALAIEGLTREKRARIGLPPLDEDGNEPNDKKNKKGDDAVEKPLQLAILGRQNVGKSTLVNSILSEERVIAGETPGLTRDSISIEWSWEGRPVRLVDTAGIRRGVKRDRANEIEDLAVLDAMRAMKLADVAVLVLDARAKVVQRQELAIADAVVKEGRSLVIVANKMDLVLDGREYTRHDFAGAVRDQIETRFPMLRKTPVVAMSSLYGKNVTDLLPVVFNARDRWARIVPTGTLNRWLEDVLDAQAPPMTRGRRTKIKYLIQTKGRPPTFLLFCNVDELPVSYLRYLTRNFQDTFDMYGMEVRMVVKKSAENPYAEKKTKKPAGVGGWKGRQKRLVAGLRRSGQVPLKGKRRR